MKFLIILFILLTSNIFGQQQKITNKDLTGSWFTNNEDSTFFLSDTISIIKRTNLQPNNDDNPPFIEPELEILNNKRFLNLLFKRCHKLEYHAKSHPIKRKSEVGRWKLKNDTIIVRTKTNVWVFQIISIDQVEFNYLISNHPKEEYRKFHTQKLTLKRTK
ncbi:MAG: hypothetical protein HYU68_11585 [Bacteroidetes bacterium]|nr:hypothetical protein [Bacteroidota bacterium]